MPRSVTECLAPALAHVREQLFSPFRLSQWWRLAVVGFLAGAGGQRGCGLGFPPMPSSPSSGTSHAAPPIWPDLPTPGTGAESLWHFAWLVGLVILVGVVLALLMLAISSVFRFILYQSVVERECRIRPSWRRWQSAGWRFFLWQLALSVGVLATILLVVAVPLALMYRAGWFDDTGAHLTQFVVLTLTLVPVMFLVIIAATIARVLVNDFAVPVMALEGVGVVDAWRRVRGSIVPRPMEFAIYVLVKVILAIAAGIAMAIITMVALVPLAIVGAIVVVVAILIAIGAGIGWNAVTIALAVLAGLVALAVIVAITALCAVPVTVFFMAFSIYYVADRYPPLAAWLAPHAPGAMPLVTGPVG